LLMWVGLMMTCAIASGVDTELGRVPIPVASHEAHRATQLPQPPIRNEAVEPPTIAVIARFCGVVVIVLI
jgi:hypothetical protein